MSLKCKLSFINLIDQCFILRKKMRHAEHVERKRVTSRHFQYGTFQHNLSGGGVLNTNCNIVRYHIGLRFGQNWYVFLLWIPFSGQNSNKWTSHLKHVTLYNKVKPDIKDRSPIQNPITTFQWVSISAFEYKIVPFFWSNGPLLPLKHVTLNRTVNLTCRILKSNKHFSKGFYISLLV